MPNPSAPKQNLKTLFGPDQVRNQPNVLLGSSGLPGAKQCFMEIIANSLDEVSSGFGDSIDVAVNSDGSVSIRDYGRGVPMGWDDSLENEDGTKGDWQWNRVFNRLYSSGKYSDAELNDHFLQIKDWSTFDPMDYPYLWSVGTHGVGGTATQYASEFFDVTSYSGTESLRMRFEKGYPVLPELEVKPSTLPRGTVVLFKPDPMVFTSVEVPYTWYESQCRTLSMVAGVNITLTDPSGKVTKFDATTLEDYVLSQVPDGSVEESFDHGIETQFGKDIVVLCQTKGIIAPYFGDPKYYNNQVQLHGGAHSEGYTSALVDFLKLAFQGKQIKITNDDYYMSFTPVISTLCNKVNYRNQTKDSLDNSYVREAVYDNIYRQFTTLYANREPWIMKALSDIESRALDRINRASNKQELAEVKKVMKVSDLPKDFVTCLNYELRRYDDVELFLTEGTSALGTVQLARDSDTQCIYPLRGKSLNVYKSPVAYALKDELMKGLIRVLGCGVATGNDATFDITKLKVGKVIFASDADDDGFHIRNLLFLTFWKFFPELLYEGKVYIAETPRFAIQRSGGVVEYVRDDESLKEALRRNPQRSDIRRFKGLGEVPPAILSETTLHKDSRNLVQLKIREDDYALLEALEVMYGADVTPRKQLLFDRINTTGYDGYLDSFRRFVSEEKEAIKAIKALQAKGEIEIVETIKV